jgi:outer membrane protein OmpA-like peptidoglycan-associated protein
MKKYFNFSIIPAGIFLLAACSNSSAPGAATSADSSADHTGNTAKGDNVQATTPGYMSLQRGDYAAASGQFQASNGVTPHSAYDELDLGDAYQHQGRMDLAEPWYRAAMTDGHGVVAVSTTSAMPRGATIEDIACRNLAIGLPPATTEAAATPCQTTLTVAVVPSTGQVATSSQTIAFNTYFDFDKATLSAGGQTNIDAAAAQIRANPALKVAIVGKASDVGTDSYNMALSERRADTIRDAMIADGVAASRIDVRWVGMREPPVPEQAGAHEPLNRVVETTVN